MKILLIGGTGFIGSFVVPRLQQAGHSITLFHRGNKPAPAGVEQIIGDRDRLNEFRGLLSKHRFDVVVDFVLSSEAQTEQLMSTLNGVVGRVVVLSSMDTYRAWGVFYGLEPGGLEPMPVTEDSLLRTAPPYPREVLRQFRQILSWANDDYDKVRVERVVMGSRDVPGTVVRLPMIYGPGDYLHRFYPVLKRVDDHRPFIIFAEDVARVRTPRGYVENVAAGIALAVTSEKAAGRIYNICEPEAFSEIEWTKKIASTVGWQDDFIVLPVDKTPAHLRWPYNTAQHLVVSSDRIRSELGYREIVPEEEAIRRTIIWERANPPKHPIAVFDYEAEDAAVNGMKANA